MSFFKPKSVETITAGLKRMVEDLLNHADQHDYDGHAKINQAEDLSEQANEHFNEASRARKAASKIGDLLA